MLRGQRDDADAVEWGGAAARDGEDEEKEPVEVERPNFGLSGVLARDERHGNMYRGVQLKWSEPADACMPKRRWRFYVFKKGEMMDKPLHLHRQSAYLVGRQREIADLLAEHPSISKQHAVLQFRLVAGKAKKGSDKPAKRTVKPYIMDLKSANGTFLNGKRIEDSRYYEMRPEDQLVFGASTREYILMQED